MGWRAAFLPRRRSRAHWRVTKGAAVGRSTRWIVSAEPLPGPDRTASSGAARARPGGSTTPGRWWPASARYGRAYAPADITHLDHQRRPDEAGTVDGRDGGRRSRGRRPPRQTIRRDGDGDD